MKKGQKKQERKANLTTKTKRNRNEENKEKDSDKKDNMIRSDTELKQLSPYKFVILMLKIVN